MARHDLISNLFLDGVYFANPGSPWQHGSNENMNGLLRQYFPRSMDLRTATVDDLHRVEELLNNRPRKILGWSTPAAAFAALLSMTNNCATPHETALEPKAVSWSVLGCR